MQAFVAFASRALRADSSIQTGNLARWGWLLCLLLKEKGVYFLVLAQA